MIAYSVNILKSLSISGSESSIRLVDVDGDGLKDIITGLAIGKDISTMITEPDMDKFCRSIGKCHLSLFIITTCHQHDKN